MKYAGLDIDIFYSGAAHGSRATTSQIALPEVLTIPEIMTCQFHLTHKCHLTDSSSDEPEPGYDSYTPEGMPAFPHDFPNDMDLHVATGELFTFNSRSPSFSSSSLTSSSSPSSSPSPSPLEFQDEPRFSLPHVNIAQANASYDPETSGAFPAMSPVSQLMHAYGLDVSDYPKQQWA